MLPASLVRRRIAIQLGDHLEWLRELYAERGFDFGEVRTEPAEAAPQRLLAWCARDFEARYEPASEEGRPRELQVTWRNLPSPGSRKKDVPQLAWEHRYAVVLPPTYPSSLQMRLVNLTPTLHPRMLPPEREAPACIFPNADLDGTLRELWWNLFFRPDMVRPPELFDEEDAGFRPSEMTWYSNYGPQRLHDELLAAWHERQTSLAAVPAPSDGDATQAAATLPEQPSAEREPTTPAAESAPPAAPYRILGAAQNDEPPPPFRVVDDES